MLRARTGLVLAGFLLIISIGLTFDNLLTQIGSCLPGTPDQAAFTLTHIWWPVFSMRVPDGLAIHAYNGAPYLANHLGYMPILQSGLFTLLNLSGNPVLALNLLLIASQAAMYISVLYWLRSKRVPLELSALGGALFVLSPLATGLVEGADIIGLSMWILPLALLAWDGWIAKPTFVRAALVVIALYGAVLAGLAQVAWIVGLWLPYAIWTGWHLRFSALPPDDSRAEEHELARRQVAGMALVLLVLLLIHPLPTLVRTYQGNEPALSSIHTVSLIELRSFLGYLRRSLPAVAILATLTIVFARREKPVDFWLIAGGLSLVVAFGMLPDPLRMIMAALDLPYQPLFTHPAFFGFAMFALLTYCGVSWSWAWETLQPGYRWGILATGLALALVTNLNILRPLPTHPIQQPGFYREIASEPEDYLLLEYPFGLMSVTDGRSLGMHAYLSRYVVWHHKRTLSGIAPYYDTGTFQSFESMPFLYPDAIAEDDLPGAAEALGTAVREWRIGYVVVQPDLLPAETLYRIDTIAGESGALCPAVAQGGLIVYRALWHPYGCEAP